MKTGKRTGKRTGKSPDGFLMWMFIAAFAVFAAVFLWRWRLYREADSAYARISAQAVTAGDRQTGADGERKTGTDGDRKPGMKPGMEKSPDGGGKAEETAERIQVDFAFLKEKNPEIAGWLYCPGTVVNYPVLQAENNEYYSNHLYDKTPNRSGALFMDCRNAADFTDRNTIIYGHNMKNGTMFGLLDRYDSQEFYGEHPVWYLMTPEKDYRIDLVSGFVTKADSDVYRVSFDSEADWKDYCRAWKARSLFQSGRTDGEAGAALVTLSTCSYEFQDARFLVQGILTEIE